MRSPRLLDIVTLIAVVVLVALGLMPGARTAVAGDQTVSWGLPATSSVTVDPGDTVTWTWSDDLPHTVTSLSGPISFDSGQMTGSGQTFAVTFTEPGTYTYQCKVHPSDMSGSVTLQASPAASPTPAEATPSAPTTGSGSGGSGGAISLWLAGVFAVVVVGALIYGGWRVWR
jgi:plastocyanin